MCSSKPEDMVLLEHFLAFLNLTISKFTNSSLFLLAVGPTTLNRCPRNTNFNNSKAKKLLRKFYLLISQFSSNPEEIVLIDLGTTIPNLTLSILSNGSKFVICVGPEPIVQISEMEYCKLKKYCNYIKNIKLQIKNYNTYLYCFDL
jgi:hypothetical protein